MPHLTLRGTLYEQRDKIAAIKGATIKRMADGYNVFQKNEKWKYTSERMSPGLHTMGTCPKCLELDRQNIFRGDNIPTLFWNWSWRKSPRRISPRTHSSIATNSIGECKCWMDWTNTSDVMGELIHKDYLAVI